jgi:two-component system phosphate regulon sensor histidine kinase PhoR
MRRDFVAHVSHELKTPLAAIRGCAETLSDGALDDPAAAHPFLDRILAHCGRLETLVSDLLMLSRLETAERSRVLSPVDLANLARRVAEQLGDQTAARDTRLTVTATGDATLLGEPDALERMLANLADNAVKYGRPGGAVAIEVEGRPSEVLLRVRDDGPGIPTELLPRVFERFFRLDGGRGRAEGGTGLGLAIVKHTALAHGGTVEIESALGHGSTFHVRLPRTSAST